MVSKDLTESTGYINLMDHKPKRIGESSSAMLRIKPTPTDLIHDMERDKRNFLSPLTLGKCNLTDSDYISNVKTTYTH